MWRLFGDESQNMFLFVFKDYMLTLFILECLEQHHAMLFFQIRTSEQGLLAVNKLYVSSNLVKFCYFYL